MYTRIGKLYPAHLVDNLNNLFFHVIFIGDFIQFNECLLIDKSFRVQNIVYIYDTMDTEIHFNNIHLHNKTVEIIFNNIIPGKINYSSDIVINVLRTKILIIFNSEGSIYK